MTIIEAVRKVLDESEDPMHYTDIAESIMNQRLAFVSERTTSRNGCISYINRTQEEEARAEEAANHQGCTGTRRWPRSVGQSEG